MAASSFEIWKAELSKRGLSRPNKFEAVIYPPAGAGWSDTRGISVRIKKITMPGKNIDTSTNDTVYGPTHELARGLTYADEITISFWLSDDLTEKREMEKWQNYIYDTNTYALNFYDDYIGTIAIYQLDDNHEKTAGVELRECFPKTVSPIEYDNDSVSAIGSLDVGFAFKEWREITGLGRKSKSEPPVVGHSDPEVNTPVIIEPSIKPTSSPYSSALVNNATTKKIAQGPDMTVDTIGDSGG